MLTTTDTSLPLAASDGGLGVTVVVAPVIPTPERYALTALVTVAVDVVVLYPPTRAPSRDAFVKSCTTTIARPTSIVPATSVRKTGATMANSTIAAPRRDGRRI